MNKIKMLAVFAIGIIANSLSLASPATAAPTDLKGFFGESLVDDIYQPAGRKLIPYKIDPNLHGPDKIYRLATGQIEIHEVKAYSSWAGKAAMQSTAGGRSTYELSARWCENWIKETLASSTSSEAEKSAARLVADAIRNKQAKFIYDEINLATQQFRSSDVLQVGLDGVSLHEKMGPVRLTKFEDFFSRKTKDFINLKMGNLDKVMTSPKMNPNMGPISRKDQLKLIPEDICNKAGVEKIEIGNGLMTENGRLLVSIKVGAQAGLLVFAADAGYAAYQYLGGDIIKPEFQQKIADAAVKGTFVGSCVGVTVFLGACPGGWCVLAVSIGSYFIVDNAVRMWHNYQNSKYLTIDDLKAWGISSDTTLDFPIDSPLEIESDTVWELPVDSILEM
ncbi:MAG: hypothetical protein MJ033_07680 [Victivallaceae bacterium]|nr:hypothetical protein [Victivallaceae bacterium]